MTRTTQSIPITGDDLDDAKFNRHAIELFHKVLPVGTIDSEKSHNARPDALFGDDAGRKLNTAMCPNESATGIGEDAECAAAFGAIFSDYPQRGHTASDL
jgi:hypothetical protein